MTVNVLPSEADEDYVNDFIQEYSDAKRLAPHRSQELAEAAMKTEQPAPPDADVSDGHGEAACGIMVLTLSVGMLRVIVLPMRTGPLARRGGHLEGCSDRDAGGGAGREEVVQMSVRARNGPSPAVEGMPVGAVHRQTDRRAPHAAGEPCEHAENTPTISSFSPPRRLVPARLDA